MDASQWAFVLAPGITPASEEALENFTGRLDPQYEESATMILETWPVLAQEPQAASWTSTPAAEADDVWNVVSTPQGDMLVHDDDMPPEDDFAAF